MRKNSINYFMDYNKSYYFIWFECIEKGVLIGDQELCKFIDISEEEYFSIINKYNTYLDKPYPNDNFSITHFYNENEVKECIEILESYLMKKLLTN